MRKVIPTFLCLAIFLSTLQNTAFAGLGDNSGTGCGGFGSVGPVVGATAGCGGSPSQPTPTQPEDPKPDTSGSGYTYKPADNDWGYITCPNPTGPDMPQALQEYGPNGQPIGTPIVVCPSQTIPKPNVPPPPPPRPAEVWAHVSLPSPALAINPATVGITQLPSWFWVTGVRGPVTVTATIDGYSVTTTATPVAYQWNFGDGSTDTSQTPGSEFDPSVTHTYDYKGTYIVSLLVDYTGTFSYAGPGGTGTESLGNYLEPGTSIPYVVQEVRSVLMATEEG